ncbi:MAG: hypothetical protein ACKO7B_10530 [Flavobacteriales bacterium]
MKALVSDAQALITNHWKSLLAIVLTIYLFNAYTDIKQGIIDGWLSR